MYFNQPYHYYLGLCCNLASFTFCRTSRQIDAKHLTLEIGIGIGSADMVKRDRTGARGSKGEGRQDDVAGSALSLARSLALRATKNSFELRPLQQEHTNTATCIFRIFCCLLPVAMRKKGHLRRRWQDDGGPQDRWFVGSEVLCVLYYALRTASLGVLTFLFQTVEQYL